MFANCWGDVKVSNADILKKFNEEYQFIYDTEENGSQVAGCRDALNYFDSMMKGNKEFRNFVGILAEERGDLFTSDRECEALMFAMESLGVLDLFD